MLWSHHEAQKRGFTINQKALDQVRARALKDYTGHAQFKPTGQDALNEFSLNTVYLSNALAAAATVDDDSRKAMDKFAAYMVEKQRDNGSWQVFVQNTEAKMAPIFDRHDVTTLWTLMALSERPPGGIAPEVLERSKQKALQWLKENPPSESVLSLALRIPVQQRFGTPADVQALVKLLRERQDADGGWSQLKDQPSDALATGQALWALTLVKVLDSDPAIVRAWSFLVKTQKADGSWHVASRAGPSPRFSSYMGTGWATIGLVRSLPMATDVRTPTKSE